MSRVTHTEFLPLTIDYWDYYILCRLNIEAARVLQRMEYWDRTKGAASTEGTQDQFKTEDAQPGEDTSRFIWKSEEELYWELMGSCGERMLANVLKFLVNDLSYLACRKNPYRAFDRTKQYQLHYELIQQHVTTLGTLVKAFVDQGRRLQPVQYAIEAFTHAGTTIDQLTVSIIAAKLAEFHTQLHQDEEDAQKETGKKLVKAVLPGFIRVHLKKDESHGFTAASPFRTMHLSIPHNASFETRTLQGTIPKITHQRLPSKITVKEAGGETTDTHTSDEIPATPVRALLDGSNEERVAFTSLMEEPLNNPRVTDTEQPCEMASSKQTDVQEMLQKSASTPAAQRDEGSPKDEDERVPAPPDVPIRPAGDAPLVPETLVQLNEFKRGAWFDKTMRAAQLQAARTILALPERIGVADFEHAFDEFNNAKGQALYGEILISHLAEVEPKHGRHRILRVLERVRHREQSRAKTPTHQEAAASPARLHLVSQPDLTDAQRAQLEAIKAKLGTQHPPRTKGA